MFSQIAATQLVEGLRNGEQWHLIVILLNGLQIGQKQLILHNAK